MCQHASDVPEKMLFPDGNEWPVKGRGSSELKAPEFGTLVMVERLRLI